MAVVKWIKLNVDMFDDEKIKIIQAMPDGDTILVIWIKLIALAGKTNDGGYIYISENIPYTDEMLSIIMNKPILTIKLAMETFNNLKMIESDTKGIYLVNFEKHQSLEKMERIKEQNRLRKQRERERKLLVSRNVTQDVTQCHATDIEEDKDKEEEIEGEKKEEKKKKYARKPFVPPTLEEVQEYCNNRGNKVDAKKFYDYYDAGDWIDGKGKEVKNWKQKVITWESKTGDNQERTVGANGIAIKSGKSELEGVF